MIGRVQAQYFSHILKIIRESPGTSRVQLAKSMNLDRSSISNLINALMDKRVIRHRDGTVAGEKSGRKQIPLEIVPDFGIVIGIQVQQDSVLSVFTNLAGKLLFMHKDIVNVSGNNLVGILLKTINKWKAEASARGERLLGIGIGITGVVDNRTGVVRLSWPLGIDEPLRVIAALQEGNDFPVFLDNDTNCCCWGVLAFSPDRNVQNFLYVLGEFEADSVYSKEYRRMSTGWAFSLNGTVYYGDSGSAGEFKSFLCRSHSEDQFSIDYRTRLKMKTDPDIRRAFLLELARNIAFTVNTLNLSHVFLGGNLYTMTAELSDMIRGEVTVNWLYPGAVKLDLIYSRLEDYPVALGAAGLAVERLFDLPFMHVSAIVQEVFSFAFDV